jgi:Uma2 family endonuclease
MSVAHRINEAEYTQIVLSDREHQWELVEGQLREKPGMSWEHVNIVSRLNVLLQLQLDWAQFRVLPEARVRRPAATIFLPDLLVVPTEYGEPLRERPGTLAVFPGPLPLVVEVWSASTGNYDVDTKIPVYMQRGDLEIWRIHPYEQTLTAWVRQLDGTYLESVYRDGTVTLSALPSATISLAELFDV